MVTHKAVNNHPLKKFAIDVMMFFIFMLLLALSSWIVWVYYFRGPVDIETRGFVSETIRQQNVQPAEVEKYTLEHFHSLDDVVLTGINYKSSCLQCHGDYPHSETKKVRAFFNAHSWFMACEVCHVVPAKGEAIVYRWIDNDTENQLQELLGEAGNYGGRIVPFRSETGVLKRLDQSADEELIQEYLRTEEDLSSDQREAALENIHKTISSAALSCDECHREKGVLNLEQLLYSAKVVSYLESIDMGAMIKTYQEFYFPKALEPRN